MTEMVSDVDFNLVETFRQRIENIDTLPTMTVDEAGYICYNDGKLKIWDGSAWQTWGSGSTSVGWVDVALSGGYFPNNETYVDFYNEDGGNEHFAISFGGDEFSSLGIIKGIGSSASDAWKSTQNRYVAITAQDYCWFDLKETSVNTNHSKLSLGCGKEFLSRIKKALFAYNSASDEWELLSYVAWTEDDYETCGCHDYSSKLKESNSDNYVGADYNLSDNIMLEKSHDYYYKITVSGSVAQSASRNDRSFNFKADGVYNALMYRTTQDESFVIWKAVKHEWVSGDEIEFTDTFIVEANDNMFVAPNIKTNNINTDYVVQPTSNYSLWTLSIDIQRCRKEGWHKRYAIQETPVGITSGYIPPADTGEFLPFAGTYELDIFVQVDERETGNVPANTGTAQTLSVDSVTINVSPIHSNIGTISDHKMVNNSLQGNLLVYRNETSCASRRSSWQAVLPNGVAQKIVGGYAHIRYIGCESDSDGCK